MYYVYIIQSLDADRKLYYGYTSNLRQRMEQHNAGKGCKTTKSRQWRLVYYESYISEADARQREQKIKRGNANRHLLARISHSLLSEISEAEALR